MKTTYKPVLLAATAFLAVVLALQWVRKPVENPPVTHPIQAPAEVTAIFRKACYDCHSNETKLTWYDKIAPVSWLIAADVEAARTRFNFSTFDSLAPADQQGKLWEMVNMAAKGRMPLKPYAALHPEARLTGTDLDVLKKYVRSLSPSKFHDSTVVNQEAREFEQLQRETKTDHARPVVANGIAYLPDYRNWQVISTTNRFDLHSIRILYGNSVAVKAAKENRPFPAGSILVKAVWNSIEEANGDITPGSLNSIQMMVKDPERFPDTAGWGFAKFNGLTLKPYGKTALFNATCYNCHQVAEKNDYVFNLPAISPAKP